MTEGSIRHQLITYAFPILIGELFQQFYTLVDSAIAGNFVGPGALGAIGVSETIVRVLVGFFNGMAVGFTVIIARYFGAKDRERLDTAVNTVLQVAFFMGVAMTAGGLLLTGPILRLMDTPDDLFAQAAAYLTIYFAGILGFVLYNTIAGILRAVGDVTTPLMCLLFSSGLNIALDLVLVVLFDLGVTGVAIATIFSQWMATLVSAWVLIHRKQEFTVDLVKHRLDGKMALLLLRVGIPTGFQKTITSLSNVLVISRINYFGGACLDGWVAYSKLDNLFTVFSQSIGSALSTFVSQNLGAKKYRRMEKGVRDTMLGGTLIFLLLSTLIVLFRAPLVRLFGDDPEMAWYAQRFILLITFCKLSQLLMNVYAAALRGVGRMALVTVLMLSGIVVFRQIYLMTVASIVNTPWTIGLAYPAGWVFSGVALLLVYLLSVRKEWRELSSEPRGE